ncbi:hypothetical protein IL306_013143 [Fusarium sp. DS 682]|nr:hypothetical protein IL306_013143 [Fusarium sp. DS 682]
MDLDSMLIGDDNSIPPLPPTCSGGSSKRPAVDLPPTTPATKKLKAPLQQPLPDDLPRALPHIGDAGQAVHLKQLIEMNIQTLFAPHKAKIVVFRHINDPGPSNAPQYASCIVILRGSNRPRDRIMKYGAVGDTIEYTLSDLLQHTIIELGKCLSPADNDHSPVRTSKASADNDGSSVRTYESSADNDSPPVPTTFEEFIRSQLHGHLDPSRKRLYSRR